MVPVSSADTASLARVLATYAPRATISRAAGLLTAPHLQANTIRIELLVHLAVAKCGGRKKPGCADLARWLNRHLGSTEIPKLEDPVEDVFVTNVNTPLGNRRLFEGIWESNDYFVQVVLDTLLAANAPTKWKELLRPAFGLLQLSDKVAERIGLRRWHISPSTAKGFIPIAPATRIEERARAVTFTNSELEDLGLTRELLAAFLFTEEDRGKLLLETTGHSSLERHPLIDFGDSVILALPQAVSPAIRRFVMSELRQVGHLQAFEHALESHQAKQVEHGLLELKRYAASLQPPAADDGFKPSLHSWLLRYDSNKLIHVVLLHDRLDALHEEGLSSFLEYPEPVRVGLEKYLKKGAEYIQSLPNVSVGMTLVVLGGLGRGFALPLSEWPPNGWPLSVARISDLLMLAADGDHPIKRYLKCMKQKNWAEQEGVSFQNLNGDFNFYCFWRRVNYQVVPRDMPVGKHTIIFIGHDFVLSAREEVRKTVDYHVVQTVSGAFAEVMRLGRDANFESMQTRPMYASLPHLRSQVLGGVVETVRGPSWLVIEPSKGGESFLHLAYELWSGFMGLYDRLVTEIEAAIPGLPQYPLEIRLDFDGVELPTEVMNAEDKEPFKEPVVLVDVSKHAAVVQFPRDFFRRFQRPENTGEQLLLRAIAQALWGIHEQTDHFANSGLLDTLLTKVIGNAGMRVLHVFHTYLPIEHLLAQHSATPIFLAHEDFVFAKLQLSDGCVGGKPAGFLKTKAESNEFLHKVVDKIRIQLSDLLRQFNRSSVIREVLAVHEAQLQDRDHWRRTALAVIALYSSSEDVLAVAQRREQDRNQVAVPARTILEMAICECPEAGGNELSRWQLDELLAKAALLLEAATDSDAINGGLIEPVVQLHANGEYTMDRDFYQAVIRPFLATYLQDEFASAAAEYETHYDRKRPGERKLARDIYSEEYIRAFSTEFKMTLDETVDGLAELMEFAVELGSPIVETTIGDIRERFMAKRGLSHNATDAFLRTFCLFHRTSWADPPAGFNRKDLYPWRFRRRLSATVRPLFAFGQRNEDKVLYGAGALMRGVGYLLERSERGRLPEDFFSSPEMHAYIGAVNHERGHAFARRVADEFRKMGWQARNELQMTELGGPSELGDIDVLAWMPGGRVLLLECKRLQLARTVAEVAEICRRFRGESKDELHRHMGRVAWVGDHIESLTPITGFRPNTDRIDAWLVTNTDVPLMYLTTLPIGPEKVIPIGKLANKLSVIGASSK